MSTAYTVISSGQLPQDWPENYGSSGTLGIFCTVNFTSDDGKSWVAGTGNSLSAEFVTEAAITVVGNTATYATYSLPKTDTACTPNTVRYFAVIFDSKGGRRDVLYEDRHLRASLGNSISELQWANDNAQIYRPQLDSVPTTNQMNIAIAAAAYAPSSTTQLGLSKSSTTPTDAANPVHIESSDPKVTPDQAVNVASIRTLGTGPLQALPGNSSAPPLVNTPILETLTYSGDGSLIISKNVKLDGSANAVLTGAGDTGGMVGTVVSGGTNTVTIAKNGKVTMTSDGGALVAGRYAQISASQAGCITSVVGYPTSGQVVGRILVGGTSPVVDLFGSEVRANSGSSVSLFDITTYGAIGDGSTDNTTAIGNAQTAASAVGGGIYVPLGTFKTNAITLTVPVTCASGASVLMPATGQTLTITSDFTADLSQHFTNALSGQGTVSFAGNRKIGVVYPQWWGALGNAVIKGDPTGNGDGVINSGTPNFSSASASFPTSIVGQSILVVGAGAAGATLITTVSARPSSTSLTLAANAGTSVGSAVFVYGTSNTSAVQAALTAAATGPIPIVFMPRGNYLFPSGSLSIATGVTLQGTFSFTPTFQTAWTSSDGFGTQMIVGAGEGGSTGAFITTVKNTSIQGIACYYPAQLLALATPKLYPWFVEMNGFNITINNLFMTYPYQGIYSHGGGQHTVINVKGSPLSRGLVASQIVDSSLYENIQFVPLYVNGSALETWVTANGQAFRIGKVDDGRFINCFSFIFSIHMIFVTDAPDAQGPGGKAWATVRGGGSDVSGSTGFYLDAAQGSSAATGVRGVTLTDVQAKADPTTGVGVFVSPNFDGLLSVNGGTFDAGKGLWVQPEATGWVSVANSKFQRWSGGAMAIHIEGPVISGTMHFSSNANQFMQAGRAVTITGAVRGLSSGNLFNDTTANTFANTTTLYVRTSGDVTTSGAVADGAMP